MRLDKIQPGSIIEIQAYYRSEPHDVERVVFMGIEGEGDDRRAKFVSKSERGGTFTWDAYRFSGRWAYGSSADRISVVGVVASI